MKKEAGIGGKGPMYRIRNESQEDYLEAIYLLTSKNRKPVRSVELAEFMGFSRASICRAIGILREEGTVNMNDGFLISLTEKGVAEAKKIYEKHCFFEKQLLAAGVDRDTAKKEACRMEHIISDSSFEKLRNIILSAQRLQEGEEIEA